MVSQLNYSQSSEKFDQEKEISIVLDNVVPELEDDKGSKDHAYRANLKEARDEALVLLSSEGRPSHFVSASEDALLVRKIDRHVMPILFFLFFLQFLDKQTISFTSVFGLSKEADLTGVDYSLLGSIVYIAQLVMQPLSAYLLVKFRLSTYIPFIVTAWGISLACSGAARNFTGLLIGRFFLGTFEASVQASFILIVQIWYRRHEQGLRLACLYSATGWINVFGPLIMFGIGHINSDVVYPYQIVSILLGGVTFLVGLLAFAIFPDNAVHCKFLTTKEKIMAVERLRANQQGLETKSFKIKQVLEMVVDIKSWCWIGLSFVTSIASGGFNTFSPLILKGFGFSGDKVMLLLIPYGVLQIIFIWTGFWLNRRFSLKSIVILGGLLPCIAAAAVLLVAGRSSEDQPLLLFAYYLMSVFALVNPTVVNWQASNVAGHTKKSATTASMLMGSFAGNIVGPLLFTPKDKPYYHRGIIAMLICYSVCSLLVVFTIVYLRYLSRVNQRRRIKKGKAACIVDYSMLSATGVEEQRLQESAVVFEMGSRAFDDLTDLENEEFIYIY